MSLFAPRRLHLSSREVNPCIKPSITLLFFTQWWLKNATMPSVRPEDWVISTLWQYCVWLENQYIVYTNIVIPWTLEYGREILADGETRISTVWSVVVSYSCQIFLRLLACIAVNDVLAGILEGNYIVWQLWGGNYTRLSVFLWWMGESNMNWVVLGSILEDWGSKNIVIWCLMSTE